MAPAFICPFRGSSPTLSTSEVPLHPSYSNSDHRSQNLSPTDIQVGDPRLTLAQLPIACVAIPAGARPLPRCHFRAVGMGRAAPMVMGTGVHLWEQMIPESCEEQARGRSGDRGGRRGRKEKVRGRAETRNGVGRQTGPRGSGEGLAGKATPKFQGEPRALVWLDLSSRCRCLSTLRRSCRQGLLPSPVHSWEGWQGSACARPDPALTPVPPPTFPPAPG